MNDSTTKRCPRCNNEFPATSEYFWIDRSTYDGLFSRCRACGHQKLGRESLPEGLKRCLGCKEVYPATLEHFGKKRTKSGLNNFCRGCSNAYNRKHYAEKHPKQAIPDGMLRCTKCKDVLPATREFFSPDDDRKCKLDSWCKACRRAYAIEGYHKTPKKHLERQRKYYAANPDVFRAKAHRRRARELSAEGQFTKQDIALQFKSQKECCWWCGAKLSKSNYHADHRVPISRGGSNKPENIVITCPNCNLSKSARMPHEWNGRLL